MDSRPAIPSVPPHRAAFGARRDGLIRALATGVTVLVAAIAVLLVAFAAVVITISCRALSFHHCGRDAKRQGPQSTLSVRHSGRAAAAARAGIHNHS